MSLCPLCGHDGFTTATPESLKAIREKAGISQAELARRLVVQPHYIAQIELGKFRANARVLRGYLVLAGGGT